jgi:hypothetical protein
MATTPTRFDELDNYFNVLCELENENEVDVVFIQLIWYCNNTIFDSTTRSDDLDKNELQKRKHLYFQFL